MTTDSDGALGMVVELDVGLVMRDGLVLRADVFRPEGGGRHPVLMTYGPYAKGLAFQQGYPDAWDRLVTEHPDVAAGSSNRFQAWETPDPEKWVPHGYAVVRVDARGWGRSPGYVEPLAMQGTRDFYECIEWAAAQPWSTGKVGLLGISYYAMTQWLVAGLQPPHLTAMVPWEGLSDFYRDMNYHGGIMSTAVDVWYRRTISTVQHGIGEKGFVDDAGEPVCGPETLSDEDLAMNRSNYPGDVRGHAVDDGFHRERSADFSRITVPFLSSGNWGGHGRHLRGNVEAFVRAASAQKWLEIHGREHWTEFYTDYGVSLQRRFLDHFLKGEDNGWDRQRRVILQVRTLDGFVQREEDDWPIPRTAWTRLHLDPAGSALVADVPASPSSVAYEATGDGVTFLTGPLDAETELTGPVAAKLFVSSATTDADLFVVLRVFDPDGGEVVFQGAVDPHTPVAQGWLRASHRALDPELSREWRPWHPHDAVEPLEPGAVYELDVELWPTSIVVPAGYRIGFTVRGRDYEYSGTDEAASLSHFRGSRLRGSGIYLHDDPGRRPDAVYGRTVTLHAGPDHPSHVLLPVIP